MSIFQEIKKTVEQLKNKITGLQNLTDERLQELESLDKSIYKLQKDKPVISNNFPTTGQIIKFWLTGIIIYFMIIQFYEIIDIVYLIITAFILSVAMESMIERVSKNTPRSAAIGISYFLLGALLLSGFLFVIPFVLAQLADLVQLFLTKIFSLQEYLKTHTSSEIIGSFFWLPGSVKSSLIQSVNNQQFVNIIQQNLLANLSQIVNFGSSTAQNIGNTAIGAVTGVFSVLFQVSLVFTLSILFSIEKDGVINVLATMAGSRREYYSIKIARLYKKLGFRLQGQLLLGVWIGIMVYVFLWVLSLFGMDLPNKSTLSIISGLTELVPYIGPLLGAIPAVLIALISHGFRGVVVVGILFFVIQRTENNVLIPIVMNKTLGISPVLIFISMVVGGFILGFVGIIIAVPLAVIVTVMLDDKFGK